MEIFTGIRKRILQEGDMVCAFPPESKASIHYKARRHDNQELIDCSKLMNHGPLELRIGKQFIMAGLEIAVKSMKLNEIAVFEFSAEVSQNFPRFSTVMREAASGHTSQHCCMGRMHAPGSGTEYLKDLYGLPIDFELELIRVQDPGSFEKEHWEIPWLEKIKLVPQLKEDGNTLFKAGKYKEAMEKFKVGIGYVTQLTTVTVKELPISESDALMLKTIRPVFLLNMATCLLQLEEYVTVVDHTTEVLKTDPTSAKAYFRRGQAHLLRGRDLDLALQDFDSALALVPGDPAVLRERHRAAEANARANAKDQQTYKGMFG